MARSAGWKAGADTNLVKLAIARCLIDTMDIARWREFGLLTGSGSLIDSDPRLLRALHFGDDDYAARVYALLPSFLGEVEPIDPNADVVTRLPNLPAVTDFLDALEWLRTNDVNLYSQVAAAAAEGPQITFADGELLDAAEAAAIRLGVAEMMRQVTRIRRDVVHDPEAAIGHAKELMESTCKTILGMTGAGPNTHQEIPSLVNQTLHHLGVHPSQLGEGTDPSEARAVKRLMGGVSSVLTGAGELRNARGTGHGRSGAPVVDAAVARLAVGSVSSAVVFLCELYESRVHFGNASLVSRVTITASAEVTSDSASIHGGEIAIGSRVRHRTFGEGVVQTLEIAQDEQAARIRFDGEPAPKLLLLRYVSRRPDES